MNSFYYVAKMRHGTKDSEDDHMENNVYSPRIAGRIFVRGLHCEKKSQISVAEWVKPKRF